MEQPSKGDARAWQRWLRAEQPTGPMPLVDRLQGTPFQHPRRADAPRDVSAVRSAELALELGELLVRSGASTRDVEASLIAVTTALGLEDVEVDITTQSIQLQHAVPGDRPATMLRVARRSSRDHGRLVAAHRLVADLAAGACSGEEARARLDVINAAPKAWPRWVVTVAYGVLAASVCALVGGGLRGVLVAFVASVAVDRFGRVLARRGWPEFFITFAGAAIASVVAVLVAWPGWIGPRDASAVVAGGIVVLLPGRLLAASFEDAIFGFLVTATARLLQVLLVGAAIGAGVAVGVTLADRVGLVLDVEATGTTVVDVARGILCAAVASLASAVAYRATGSLVVVPALIGGLAYACYGSLRAAGLSAVTATAVAAVVVGLLGRTTAGRYRAPALVLAVPALSALLPGLATFRAMNLLATDSLRGLNQLFAAMATALAIGAGVTLGDLIASPADRWTARWQRAGRS